MGGLKLSAFALEKSKRLTCKDEEEWRASLPSQGTEKEDFLVLEAMVRSDDPCEACHFTCFTGSGRCTVCERETS